MNRARLLKFVKVELLTIKVACNSFWNYYRSQVQAAKSHKFQVAIRQEAALIRIDHRLLRRWPVIAMTMITTLKEVLEPQHSMSHSTNIGISNQLI